MIKSADRIGIWSVGFCEGSKTGEPGEKSSKQGREPTQPQPTCDAGFGNRTQAQNSVQMFP